MATRAEAIASAKEVQRANAEADALEAELRAARERTAAATRTAQSVTREFGRVSELQRQAASSELEQLRAEAEAVLSEKPDKTRVTHDVRRYARSMIGRYVLGDGGPDPQLTDPLWGRLHGLQGTVIHLMGGIEDEELYDQADALECRLHRAVLTRLHELAGESES